MATASTAPARPRTFVKDLEEEFGVIRLTALQLDFIVQVAQGENRPKEWGGTVTVLRQKIEAATGWRGMKATPMFCRLAYRHGLVRL